MSESVEATTDGLTQERARRTRAKILETAALAFARDGYDGASLNAIIRESGVTKGAFYFHFPSKGELALAAFRLKQEEVVAQTLASMRPTSNALEELAELLRARAVVFRENPSARCVSRLGPELGSQAGPDSEFARFQELAIGIFADLVARGQREGAIRRELDARQVGEDVFASIIGADRVSQYISDHEDLEERTEHLVRLLVHGMAATPAARTARKGRKEGRKR